MAESDDEITKLVRGYLVNWYTKKEHFEQTLDYVPKDRDVILATYPKVGTHFMSYILLQIVFKGESFPTVLDLNFKELPFMHYVGKDVLDSLKVPRLYKHHCPYDIMHKNHNSKVIYVYRNPEDTFVSHYMYFKEMYAIRGKVLDFDEHFENFLSGNVLFGSYFKNILSFFNHSDDENLLMVSFSALISDKRSEILRIAKFLGSGYYEQLVSDSALLDKIMNNTSFQYMKDNLELDFGQVLKKLNPELVDDSSSVINLFRKGGIGCDKKALSPEQRIRLKNEAVSTWKGTRASAILEEWYQEGL